MNRPWRRIAILILAACQLADGKVSSGAEPTSSPFIRAGDLERAAPQAVLDVDSKYRGKVPEAICEKMQGMLDRLKETTYQHKIEVDEARGVYNCDCSGLVGYILREVAPEHARQLPHRAGKRPRAEDFYRHFVSLPTDNAESTGTWRRIDRLDQARRGDILAYKFTAGAQADKDTTGHVAIVFSAPEKQANGEFMLIVADATNSPHGEDSRTGHGSQSGIGRGKMWFGVDGAGRPVYYRWSRPNGSKHRSTIDGIAIGRAY